MQPYSNTHKMQMSVSSAKLSMRKMYPSHLKIASPKNNLSYSVFLDFPQNKKIALDEARLQANQCLLLIDDPLWKQVCTEVAHMMGPLSILKIWNSKLGEFLPQSQAIHLYCQAEETAQFAEEYSFVILEGLRKYFPALKELKVTVN